MSLGGVPQALIGAVDDWLQKKGQPPQVGAGQPAPAPVNTGTPRIGAVQATPGTFAGPTGLAAPAKIGAAAVPQQQAQPAAQPTDTYDPSKSPMVGAGSEPTPNYAARYHDWASSEPAKLSPDAGKPSMLRKIGGIAAGAATGFFNPTAGGQIGSAIINGPRNELEREHQQAEDAWNRQGKEISTEAGLADAGSKMDLQAAQAAKDRSDVEQAGKPKPKEEEWTTVPGVTGPNGELVQQEKNSGQQRYSTLAGVKPNKPPTEKNEKYATLQLPNGQKVPGKEDSQGNLLTADGKPAPQGTITYQQPNYGQLVLPTKTQSILVNGIPTDMGWNEKTQRYDVPMGQSASGAYAHEEAQAGAVQRAGNDLKSDIQKNRDHLGNIEAIVNSAFLGTPIADPVAAGLATKLASYAALNPALHGAKGMQAIKEFEKMVGGIPKNPDALIASIDAISQTAGAINPNLGGNTGTTGGGAQPNEQPVYQGGKLIGYTTDGKTISRTP